MSIPSQDANQLSEENESGVLAKRLHEFSSENNKLEITNLPRHIKYHVVKQLIERQFKLSPHKIKVGDRRAFVAFATKEDLNLALAKINNQEFKGKPLKACLAEPRHDPFIKKICQNNSRNLEINHELSSEPPTGDDLNSQVCPLWKKPYDEQLLIKEASMKSVLNINKQLLKLCPGLKRDAPELFEWAENSGSVCCQFDGVEPSPVIIGYRNKCEFNIGGNGEVGFRLGRYKDGSERVLTPPSNCPIVNKHMFEIVEKFQNFLKSTDATKLRAFNQVTHEGNVRQITVRTNESNECLLIIDLHPQDLSQEDLDKETKSIVGLFESNNSVVSIYLNVSEKGHLSSADETLKLVYGESHLFEQLIIDPALPLKFRIGPNSFFQVNTKAAELLYRSIIDFAQLDGRSLVLDVGCGTGTISLSLARQVSYVIGIEIVKSAIEDARLNAVKNDISNVSFFVGKAEELISESISILKSKLREQDDVGEIVAIVDPPRVGFNSSFIKSIRASNIKKIIYVACDPKANTNLVSLCRPKSKAYQGEPFVPIRAKAFDLFPHTKFCELVVVYERLLHKDSQQST